MVSSNEHQAILAARMQQLQGRGRGALPPRKPAQSSTSPAAADERDYYTLQEAAARVGVSVPTLKSWGVPRMKVPGSRVVRVPKAAFEKFIAEHTTAGED